uniref:Uncharacterized protein n=1 Tax=Arundo donax TaxID=35708 RepID=A0A0A9AHS0_ARUDO
MHQSRIQIKTSKYCQQIKFSKIMLLQNKLLKPTNCTECRH